MSNYDGYMGYNQPYPPATGPFAAPGAGYPPAAPAAYAYPPANQLAPSIGFVPPPGPGYPPSGPGYPPAGPGPMYPPQVSRFLMLCVNSIVE